LGDDVYEFRQKGTRYQKAWVYLQDDSIQILTYENPDQLIYPNPHTERFFLKRSFDVDVMTVGFKYRPSLFSLPRQLNTDFNGNVYLGYRLDRFKVKYNSTPFGRKPVYGHRGITAGVFGGIGSTAITPWTTNNISLDEYNGFVLSRGMSVMVAFNKTSGSIRTNRDMV
jgi:hypothetical protein